jgi:hypothetical protein
VAVLKMDVSEAIHVQCERIRLLEGHPLAEAWTQKRFCLGQHVQD